MVIMEEKNIKLLISYDGSGFSGWQKQDNPSTIQQTIEEAIRDTLKTDINLIGCGRTDAKVHAISYVANFITYTRLSAENLKNAINSKVAPKIIIKEAEEVPLNFHSRYDAKGKIYRYLLTDVKSPFLKNYVTYVKPAPNLDKMLESTSFFCGTHNFKAFQASGNSIKNTVRKIDWIKIKQERTLVDKTIEVTSIEIKANGFLYKMARNIVGAILYAGWEKFAPEKISSLIESEDRKLSPPTAKPEGLYLKQVFY